MTTKRILVTYASRAGATAGVAEAIAEVLKEDPDLAVDVKPVGEASEIASYDAVVVGSAVRGWFWLPEGQEFLRRERKALANRPVAAFGVCLRMRNPTCENTFLSIDWTLRAFADAGAVAPRSVGAFAGVLDYSKLEPEMAAGVKTRMSSTPEGDYRDWEAVKAWATRLKSNLFPESSKGR